MKAPERETIKRHTWKLSDDALRELHAQAFGKECKRPLRIDQSTLAALLLDFNYLATRHLQE